MHRLLKLLAIARVRAAAVRPQPAAVVLALGAALQKHFVPVEKEHRERAVQLPAPMRVQLFAVSERSVEYVDKDKLITHGALPRRQ